MNSITGNATIETEAFRGETNYAVTSPIASLPPELLAGIFQLTVVFTKSPNGPGAWRMVKNITHVCSQWREVALKRTVCGACWISIRSLASMQAR